MFWRFLSKMLKVTGCVAFFSLSSVQLYLIYHWRATRPQVPNPALGWMVTLPWCLGAYGTVGERAFLNSSWPFVAFLMICLSLGIDYYKFGVLPFQPKPTLKNWWNGK